MTTGNHETTVLVTLLFYKLNFGTGQAPVVVKWELPVQAPRIWLDCGVSTRAHVCLFVCVCVCVCVCERGCKWTRTNWHSWLFRSIVHVDLYEYYITSLTYFVGQDSSVGKATRYRLNGPGIESRWGRDFPHPSRPALGPTQPPIQWILGLSRG